MPSHSFILNQQCKISVKQPCYCILFAQKITPITYVNSERYALVQYFSYTPKYSFFFREVKRLFSLNIEHR